MKAIFNSLLLMLSLLISTLVIGQNQNPTQSVCPGATQTYWVTATPLSTYTWTIGGSGGTVQTGQGTNSISVLWTNTPGTYSLQVIETDQNSCVSDPKIVSVTVYPLPTAVAGTYPASCGLTPISLSGSSATNYSSLVWSSSGTGSFDNASLLHPVYTPSAADLAAGSVTLTITAQGLMMGTSGGNIFCSPASSSVTISLIPPPTISAGNDFSVCGSGVISLNGTGSFYSSVSWSGGAGGTFTDGNELTATYTPSAADILAGSVTLTLTGNGNSPCGSVTDHVLITLIPASTASAGGNASICAGSTFTLASSSVSNSSSILWSTSGTGGFNTNNILHPVYTPSAADITAGNVTLTITAGGNSPCNSVSSSLVLTIIAQASVEVGNNASVCSNSTFTLTATGANYSSLSWGTTGTGAFSTYTNLTTTYTPSAADIAAGSVTLQLTATGNAPCGNAVDNMTLTFIPAPVVTSVGNSTVCATVGTTISFSGSTAQNYSSLQWTTTGSGSITNPSSLTGSYQITAADISAGQVTFTLTAQGNAPCLSASASFTVTIVAGPQLSVGGTSPVCEGAPLNLTSSIIGATYSWTGPSSFTSTSQNPLVSNAATLGMAGIYTVTVSNIPGGCPNTSGNVTITVNPRPVTSPITHY